MTIEFYQTVMGRQFYDGTMPAIARALTRIADALEKKPKDKPRYMCKACKGFNVQHAHWVRVNTDEVVDVFGTWNQPDTAYCEDCGEPCEIEECG